MAMAEAGKNCVRKNFRRSARISCIGAWPPLAAPPAPPIARCARQGGVVQCRFRKSTQTSESAC
eukprot:7063552-Pyramimonas_sp.AAC.1